jgi:UDP-N-acetylmuramoylalanine-D-glutamate ligase
MTQAIHFKGQRVAIFGLGDTGLSLARYAAQRGAQVCVMDTRAEPPRLAVLRDEIPAAQFISGPEINSHPIDADIVLLSPGVSAFTYSSACARHWNYRIKRKNYHHHTDWRTLRCCR